MSYRTRKQPIHLRFKVRLLCIVCLYLSGCGHDHEHGHGHNHEHGHGHGHGHDHSHDTVPDRYADLVNPRNDMNAIAEGTALFMEHCANCHGVEADGKGPASDNLDPKPTALNDSVTLDTMSDAYLFWRITEGGATDGHESAMPAYEDILSPNQRWAVITYLRTSR